MKAFPKATAVGEVRNYFLYYPDHDRDERFRPVQVGESLNLGSRTLTIVPSVIHDLPTSWAHDDRDGLLFVSDAFGFSHYTNDECTLFTEELSFVPGLEDTRMVLEIALYWSRFADNHELVERMHRSLQDYPTKMVCPAHGNVVPIPQCWPRSWMRRC